MNRSPATRRGALLLLLLLCWICCAGATGPGSGAEEQRYGIVNSPRLNLREKPGTDALTIGAYPEGTRVRILEQTGAWYKVSTPDGTVGYMSAGYLILVQQGLIENSGSFVNLREGPSLDSAILGEYPSGTEVEVYAHVGEWSLVGVNGVTGYMASYFIQSVPMATTSPGATGYANGSTVNPSLSNPFAFQIDGEDDLVQQYGVSESYVDYRDGFTCTVVYPVSGLEKADIAIRTWAQGLVQYTEDTVWDAEETAELEMTVQYDAYVVGGRYAGILESGWINSTLEPLSRDIIYTLNIDLMDGSLMSAADIFPEDRLDQVLALLTDKLSALEGDLLAVGGLRPDASWLAYPVIAPEGIRILLPKNEFLPAALGTMQVTLTYDELALAQLLAMDRPVATVADAATSSPVPFAGGDRVIDPSKPMVALTFDDGPSDTTPRILRLLDTYGGRATFFVVGNRIANYEDELTMIVRQGSEVGCHTWGHKQLTKLEEGDITSQLRRCIQGIESRTGQTVRVMRPPYGSHNQKVRNVSRELGLSVILWSIDTEDWRTRNAQATYDEIMKNVKNGSIILCHDLHEPTGDAMELVIPELVRQGYQLVTVSELLSFQEGGAVAGKAYYQLNNGQ